MSQKFLKSFSSLFDDSRLRFHYAKLLDTPEEDCQVLGFVNPVVVNSDDENDNIFEPERSFSGSATFSFHAFPKIFLILGTDAYKKNNFKH